MPKRSSTSGPSPPRSRPSKTTRRPRSPFASTWREATTKTCRRPRKQIVVAQQNLDTDKNVLSHTERMYRKGFVTALQLEADKFAVEHGQLDLDAAILAKKVLEEFTRPKTVKQLESVRDAADARRHAELASVNLEKTKLERIQQQLKFCVIKAPQRGMVVYANDPDRRSSSDAPQIDEGAMIRERQTIIRLPDLNDMQVETTVHESHVPHIRPGMPAHIEILDRTWKGHVKSIASRPAPPPRYSTPTKNYSVYISIEGDLSGLAARHDGAGRDPAGRPARRLHRPGDRRGPATGQILRLGQGAGRPAQAAGHDWNDRRQGDRDQERLGRRRQRDRQSAGDGPGRHALR